MSESVKILIEADDQASAKMAAVARNAEASVKRIKTTGEQAKKSIEFSGAFANALGGTQFGAFAGQLAGITEKTSQFAEVSKLGGAGALAFRAGLVGMVGAVTIGIGRALGDVIFQTEMWKRKLEEATKESEKLSQSVFKISDASKALQLREIAAMPKALQAGATKEILEQEEKALDTYAQKARSLRREFDSWGIGWLIGGRTTGEVGNELKQAEAFLDRQRDLVQKLREPGTESFQKVQQAEEIKRVRDIVEAERERLEIQRELVTKGEEAAKALELQKRGVDEITAKELAAEEAALKKKAATASTPDLMGTFSRLLVRGPARDIEEEQLKALESMGVQLARQNDIRERELEKEKPIRMKVTP